MKKVNYLLGLVLVVLLCADGFVVGQGMTFYPAITSDEQSALLTGAVQTNDTRNVALGGNLSVDTNTLFIDATTNRVGILTTTPAYTLDVGGQARFSGGIRPNGSMAWDSVGTYNMNQWDGSTARSFFTWNTLVPTNCVTFPYGVVSIASNLTVNGTITSTNAVNAPIKAVTGSSQTNLTFWTGSAASYAALASTNASTIYFITN